MNDAWIVWPQAIGLLLFTVFWINYPSGQSLDEAASAYDLAANKGNMHAAAALGAFYENGLGGRQRNNETALKYLSSRRRQGRLARAA